MILRHPVDRAFAHWAHFRAAGGEEITDFGEAIRQERPRQQAGFAFTYQYLGWGRYHAQLPQFFEHFGRERVLVHLYDELCADSAAVVRSTLRFLEVECDEASPVPAVGRHNEMPIPRFPGVQRALDGRGRAGRALRRVVPGRARRATSAWAASRLSSRPSLDADLRAELTARLAEDISRLEELLDRDLAMWR